MTRVAKRAHTRPVRTSDAYPGTGLGWAICKRIIERHAGCIWAESAPGKGVTSFFPIPDRALDVGEGRPQEGGER